MVRACLFLLLLVASVFAQEPPAHYIAQPDSVSSELLEKIDQYTRWGDSKSKTATKLFIGGGVMTASGIALVVTPLIAGIGEKNEKDSASYDGDSSSGSRGMLFVLGTALTIGGISMLMGGSIAKIKSNRYHNRAQFYKDQLNSSKPMERSFSWEIIPIFNPVRQAYGGNLLLDF